MPDLELPDAPYLEVQLKPHHKPVKVYSEWPKLVRKYTKYDGRHPLSEPVLNLRRNAFYRKNDELRLRDSAVIELLYYEAKHNFLTGRYPRDMTECFLLGALSARIHLGNFVPHHHNANFFRCAYDFHHDDQLSDLAISNHDDLVH